MIPPASPAVPVVLVAATAILVVVAVFVLWRGASRRRSLPCPAWLSWMVDNPISQGRTNATLRQLELTPGLWVLDAGCGPGRLAVPIAEAVGPAGRVFAMDIQQRMLDRARVKADRASVRNIEFLHAPLGAGRLPVGTFDRAVLVTVLGEIPDRLAALGEIFRALKPGGFLLVSEVLGDPHYQSLKEVDRLARAVGFIVSAPSGGRLAYSVRLGKPMEVGRG